MQKPYPFPFLADALAGGRFAAVTFTKRTTGETRKIVGRLGVRCHLRGGERAYDPAAHGLLVIWDAQKRGYRSIALESVIEVRCQGRVWCVAEISQLRHSIARLEIEAFTARPELAIDLAACRSALTAALEGTP